MLSTRQHFMMPVTTVLVQGLTGSQSVAEGRVVGNHPVHPLQEILDAILGLWGEELEGENHLLLIHQ
ncbi:hypothetical protein ACFX2A_007027 [Malus domestica]